jgi:Xaa-Pro dipeptidase
MYAVATESLAAATDALRPGRPIGEVFDAHARVIDDAGMAAHRMNACGYSMGTTYAPNWMDWPMFYHGNPLIARPGMTFFIHIIIFDSPAGLAMSLGESVEVTADGTARLSRAALDFVVN